MSGPEHNDTYEFTADEEGPTNYQLPSIGLVVSFDGYTFIFTPTQGKFDMLTSPMQREILKAMLRGALELVENYED